MPSQPLVIPTPTFVNIHPYSIIDIHFCPLLIATLPPITTYLYILLLRNVVRMRPLVR